jgi:hypothetical protein
MSNFVLRSQEEEHETGKLVQQNKNARWEIEQRRIEKEL